MTHKHRALSQRDARLVRRVAMVVLVAALLIAGLFAARLVVSTAMWSRSAGTFEPLAGWMTPRYVAMSWDLPPEIVATTLGIAQDGSGRTVTLAELAQARGQDVAELIDGLNTAIATYRGTSGD